jgi:hypothetical protein
VTIKDVTPTNPIIATLRSTSSSGHTYNAAVAGAVEVPSGTENFQCSDYPPDGQITFSGIVLADYNNNPISTPTWSPATNPDFTPQCGYYAQVTPTKVTLYYLPTVNLNPYGTVQVSSTPPPYNTAVVVPVSLAPLAAPADVTVTVDRQVISQCGPCLYPGKSPPCTIFQRNDTVVISQGQTTGTFSDVAGRNPSCNTLPITTQWTITGAVLAPTNLSLDLSLVPLEQLMLSGVN